MKIKLLQSDVDIVQERYGYLVSKFVYLFIKFLALPTVKQIVTTEEMVDRIKIAVAARKDPNFVIMARTDALANEGLDAAIKRAEVMREKVENSRKKIRRGEKMREGNKGAYILSL